MQDLIEAALQTVPLKEKLEQAKKSLKKKKKKRGRVSHSKRITQDSAKRATVPPSLCWVQSKSTKETKEGELPRKSSSSERVIKIRKKKKGESEQVTINRDSQETPIDKGEGEEKEKAASARESQPSQFRKVRRWNWKKATNLKRKKIQ
jgi:hypothetical protein